MFDKLFGLPAHSLLIHAPIVLLPILAIATIVLAVKASWRRRVSWWMLGAIFAVLAMLFAAQESGESLFAAFEVAFGDGVLDIDEHEELAQKTFILTLLWFVTFGALTIVEHMQRRSVAPEGEQDAAPAAVPNPYVGYALGALTSVFAVLATIWLIRTGHEGADVVWGPVTPQLFPE